MANARFEVEIARYEDEDGCYVGDQRVAFNELGIDSVEFMMSANPGEPLRPLAKVASGGEAARIMLALKRVLTLADQTPTLIFDEIDQGIGGRVGSVVGEKLWGLTGMHQVMVVTHLAQLAGYADRHYSVQKTTDGGAHAHVSHPAGGGMAAGRRTGGDAGHSQRKRLPERPRTPGDGGRLQTPSSSPHHQWLYTRRAQTADLVVTLVQRRKLPVILTFVRFQTD